MPSRFPRVGKPFSSVPALALSVLISLACFTPSYAKAPTISHRLAPGTTRPSARHIAQRATQLAPKRVATKQVQPGLPKTISIASANIEADVVSLGLLPGGKLDAPKNREDTGWYRGSVKPGMSGTAIIDGHLNTADGPGAFWNLKHVQVGGAVNVTDEHGVTRSFKVTKTAVYDVNKAPMRDIFTSTEGTRLNLITCAGEWSVKLDHYDKRLVVYTEMIPGAAVAMK